MSTPVHNKEWCLCEICRCGEHLCPLQYEKSLPKCLQTHEIQQTAQGREHAYQVYEPPDGDSFHQSTYKRDYHPPEITNDNPPGKVKQSSNIVCEPFPMERKTTYSRSYIPRPDTPLDMHETKEAHENQEKGINQLRKYYCPPHCVGDDEQRLNKNFVLSNKDLVNLDLAEKPLAVKKPEEPFAKFTSYMLDYVPHKTEVKKIKRNDTPTPEEKQSMSCETTYKKEFPPHRTDVDMKAPSIGKKSDQTSNVPFGRDGKMVTDTTTMLDFQDPVVSRNTAVKRPKEDYNPPVCKMECETTTRISYPPWDNIPPKPRIMRLRDALAMPVESDVRCLVTTYQEDFNGLQAALCPAKSIERYGRKTLEPRYKFTEARDEHDYYEKKT